MAPRRGPARLFAVDDTSVQLVWRGLAPGELTLTAVDATGSVLAAPTVVEVDPAGRPGAVVLDRLPPDTDGEVLLRHRDEAIAPVPFRTDPVLPGPPLARVATISDLHLGAKGFGHLGTIVEDPGDLDPHPIRCARAAIVEATAWGAEHLVGKGDLTNHGQVEQWRAWAGLVADCPVPVDALPGNHDRDHPLVAASLAPEDAAVAFGLSLALPLTVRDLPGTRLVLADTTTSGRNRGNLAPVLDDVLDVVAEADPAATVLLFLHHQLHEWYGQEGWPRGIDRADAVTLLRRIAEVHPRTLVSSGHTHRSRRTRHAGITATQVGATKDYPGVWAGYTVHEGGVRQLVRRISPPDVLAWTDRTRRAALGAWRFAGPGPLTSRCFALAWDPVAVSR
ncbi:MAG: metallophosphoesterase family protein [Actinobacteria bacterium]|nr:metallophosphoesterase family protein [Actinomycetota bacterium]